MNRAKLIHLSSSLANSLFSTRCKSHLLSITRVSHSINYPPTPSIFNNINNINIPFNYHQTLFFSSKTEPLTDITLSNNDWSEETEQEMRKLCPTLTHETIVHVLMNLKLDKNPQKAFDFFKWVCFRIGFDPSSVLYNMLLQTLVKKDFMEHFWVVALEMKEKGVYIGEPVYRNVHRMLKKEDLDGGEAVAWTEFYNEVCGENGEWKVAKGVIELIWRCNWGEEVEGRLLELDFRVSESLVLMVVSGLTAQPLKALRFFQWVGSVRGYQHNSVTYNEMARVLAHHVTLNKFWELLNWMRRGGYEVTTDTYLAIWRHLPTPHAVYLFEYMMDGPFRPSDKACALLLDKISESSKDVDLVYRVVDKYVNGGSTLTKVIYDGMHKCWCLVGRFDQADKIIESMMAAGYKPDNVTYSQEVAALCRLRRFGEAYKVIEKMEFRGCVPDLKTWTILIKGYCIDNQLNQALSCVGKMMENHVIPDADMLDSLILSLTLSSNQKDGNRSDKHKDDDKVLLSKKKNDDKVLNSYAFLTEVVSITHVSPHRSTCKRLIKRLLEIGRFKEAVSVLSMMKQSDIQPFSEPFPEYISRKGTIENALEFVNALSVEGAPPTSAYIQVIRSFVREGRHAEAKDLLLMSPPEVQAHKSAEGLLQSTGCCTLTHVV